MRGRYALRELWHHRLRTALAMLGVAVSTAMLVDMLMLGGGLETSFERLLASRGYGIRIAPKGTLPFDTEALIPAYPGLRDSLLTIDRVEGVAPLLAANLALRPDRPGGDAESLRVFALGVDPAEQGVMRLLAGDLPGPGGIVLEADLARQIGARVGDPMRLSLAGPLGVETRTTSMAVSGVAEFVYASSEERSVAVELGTLQRLTGRGDSISFAMVRTRPEADAEAVRAAIESGVPRVEVVTIAGLVEQAQSRLSYFRQLAWILGSVAVIVTALLVGTIATVSIQQRHGMIAALRAIGISRRSLLRALTLESVTLSALAAGVGLVLGLWTARYLESVLAGFPGLPQAIRFFVLQPSSLVLALATVLGVGTLAALLPAWHASRLDISSTLHTEEM